MAVNALYLDDWTVEAVDRSQEGYRLVARYDVEPTHCPKCGSTRQPYRHGPRAIDYVDAPVRGLRTIVAVDVQRYRCRDCSGTFMQPLPDMDPQRRMTRRCADHIREQGRIPPRPRAPGPVPGFAPGVEGVPLPNPPAPDADFLARILMEDDERLSVRLRRIADEVEAVERAIDGLAKKIGLGS